MYLASNLVASIAPLPSSLTGESPAGKGLSQQKSLPQEADGLCENERTPAVIVMQGDPSSWGEAPESVDFTAEWGSNENPKELGAI